MSLVRKELREHGWVVAGMVLLDALVLAGLLVDSGDEGGRFVALNHFAIATGAVHAVILAGRLFVREYAGRTQLFLEVLPISRARVLATKWLLGAGGVLAINAAAWGATLLWQRRTAVITLADARVALAGTSGFVLAWWAFAAMVALLGRYRWLAWGVAGVFVWALSEFAKVNVVQEPLFRLVGPAAAMARGPLPVTGLMHAGLVVLACVAMSMVLALVGSGAIAAMLARRMTARERAFVAGLVLVGAFVLSVAERKPEKPPFELASAAQAISTHATVGVGTSEDFDEAHARALGAQVAGDVDSLIDTLHLELAPTIFILPQHGLDRDAVERAKLGDSSGVVLRMAPDSPPTRVRAMVVHALLAEVTRGRALNEDRHVLLDGLSAWWVTRHDSEARAREWLRLAAGPAITAEQLLRWESTMEQLGSCQSNALAFASVDAVVQQLGEGAAFVLLQRVFSRAPRDARALFETRPSTVLDGAGVGWTHLASLVEAARLDARERLGSQLAARPAITAAVNTAQTEERGRTLEARLDGATTWSAIAATLKPWTRELENGPRLDAREPHATLPLTLAAGDRVWVALEVQDPVLDCRVRVLSERLEVP